MSEFDRLMQLAREHRPQVRPAGELNASPTQALLLREVIATNLDETQPEGAPASYSLAPSGMVHVAAQPPAERREWEDFSETARALMIWLTFVQDDLLAAQAHAA